MGPYRSRSPRDHLYGRPGSPQKLEGHQYSLLVLDFHMPHRTGVEIIRERRLKGDKTPIILMSAGMPPADMKTLGGLERVACYSKTTLMADVIEAIDELARAFLIDRPVELGCVSPSEPTDRRSPLSP